MALVELTTFLDAKPDRVWHELQRPQLLFHVAHPILQFTPVEPKVLDETWQAREYLVAMRLCGLVPIGRQVVDISLPPQPGGTRAIRDNGRSAMIRRWDHLITVASEGDGTRYTDRVEIEAGVLTPFIVLFAHWFYRHRQNRWRRLVARDFDYQSTG
ncbi:MAG: hypothetical protein AAFO77_14775 [Pseudomonadota bacterium]